MHTKKKLDSAKRIEKKKSIKIKAAASEIKFVSLLFVHKRTIRIYWSLWNKWTIKTKHCFWCLENIYYTRREKEREHKKKLCIFLSEHKNMIVHISSKNRFSSPNTIFAVQHRWQLNLMINYYVFCEIVNVLPYLCCFFGCCENLDAFILDG